MIARIAGVALALGTGGFEHANAVTRRRAA